MIADGFATGLLNLLGFGLLVLLRRFVHGEGPGSFRLGAAPRDGGLFLGGAAFGGVAFAAYAGLVLLAGRGRLTVGAGDAAQALAVLAAWGFGFLGVALAEEAFFRGYLLQKLLARTPRWVAVGIPSLLFGLMHYTNYAGSDTRWLGLANAGLMGVVLSLVVLDADSLLPAVGFHWAWNLVQLVLMPDPYPDTGFPIHLEVRAGLWAGTPTVSESGLAISVALLVLGVVMVLWYRRKPLAIARADR